MSDPPPFERNGCTARRPLFEVTVPKHTRDFPHTNTHTQTHTPTFTLPLDFDPSPSLCISYELSEKTQWIEWQRSKARPCNRPGWRGDGWLCVYDCVGTSAYLCVFDSHLLQSRIFRIWICPSWLVFEPGLFSRTSTHGHMHTHTHTSPFLFTLKTNGVKWQVFNQCWPQDAMVLICWNLPPPSYLIHPLTWEGCHTHEKKNGKFILGFH